MGYRIIVADDEPRFGHVVETNLKRNGYEVRRVFNESQLLQEVETEAPDVIVLDALMTDSFVTLGQLRADPETRDIRVIMVSARDDIDFIQHAWEHEIDLFVTKPVGATELTALVARLLADKEEEPYRALASRN